MANTLMSWSRTRCAATSSCVERGFEAQSATSAPPALSVTTRLAVSAVTCRQADTRFAANGRLLAHRALQRLHAIHLLPGEVGYLRTAVLSHLRCAAEVTVGRGLFVDR